VCGLQLRSQKQPAIFELVNQDSTMQTPIPSTASLIPGLPSAKVDALRIVANQQSLERAGHIQPIPMTSNGLAQLQLLKDVLQRQVPPSSRHAVDQRLEIRGAAAVLNTSSARGISIIEAMTAQQHEPEDARQDAPSA